MYKVVFTPEASGQYADIIEKLAPYKKRLSLFEREMEQAIRRLESMPSSFPPKGKMLAARLQKSAYYLFFKIAEKTQRVTVVMIIHQKQSEQNWPKS